MSSASSAVYNLAGDVTKRPNYLKTTIIGGILNPNNDSLGEQIIQSYMGGPGIKLRGFSRWVRYSGYDSVVGLLSDFVTITPSFNPGDLKAVIEATDTTDSTGLALLLETSIGPPNYSYWVERWLFINDKPSLEHGYTYTMDPATMTVTITKTDGTTESFALSDIYDYDLTAMYLYATYSVGISPRSRNVFIYKYGDGNTQLDGFFGPPINSGEVLPFIPLRYNNTAVSTTFLPDVYRMAKKAVRRAMNAKYDDLISKLAENPSIGDIDYAYVVFGASLNTPEMACLHYIYVFFETVMKNAEYSASAADYAAFLSAWNAADASQSDYEDWSAAQSDPSNPRYGTTAPTLLAYPTDPSATVRFFSDGSNGINYGVRLTWNSIIESHGTGLLKPDAKVGDLWIITISDLTLGDGSTSVTSGSSANHVRLCWQVNLGSWKTLDFFDLVHRNLIYVTSEIATTAVQALADAKESSFIVPLHSGVFKEIPLTVSTQMSTACCFLVANSFVESSSAWYTSSFFKVLLVVAAIVISVATAGIGDVGILGSSAAIGGALGFTGTTAAIVGAVANALAAIILVQVIQVGSIAIFGPKLGAIIGAIAGFIALSVGSSLMASGGLAGAFDSLMRVDNLIKLTDALGKGFAGYLQAETKDVLNQTKAIQDNFNSQSKAITAKYDDVIGDSGRVVDPLSLVDVTVPDVSPKLQVPSELPQDFFSRTLMSGSDICNLSNGMITNFTDVMLSQDTQLT